MSLLSELVRSIASGGIKVIDLTAPLHEDTAVISLPPERGQPWPFQREVISRYDAAGPEVYWYNIRLSEHTGTHLDAPIHWISGRDRHDVASIAPSRLIRPAVVLDFRAEAEKDADFLLSRTHVERWCEHHGALPDEAWMLYRTGWAERRSDAQAFMNGNHWPGVDPECARWLAEETGIIGIGVETVGTDSGQAASLSQPFPCHWYFQGAGKYGITQLQNLARLPPRGAVIVTSPLPIVGGTGSPSRILALVESGDNNSVSEAPDYTTQRFLGSRAVSSTATIGER